MKVKQQALFPTPHIAVKNFKNENQHDYIIKTLIFCAGVDEKFLVGGSINRPVSNFTTAIELFLRYRTSCGAGGFFEFYKTPAV